MAKNSTQFQEGLSLPKFLESYGTEQQCRDALFKLRWPTGFVCPECGNDTFCELKSRKVYQCNHCHTQTSLTSGTIFASTKLACFAAVKKARCTHVPIVSVGGRKGAEHPSFKWVNTMLGNVKNAITGTLHSVSLRHVPRYLAEFEYRFNRRYRLGDMIERLTYVGLRTPPMPYHLLRLAEVRG